MLRTLVGAVVVLVLGAGAARAGVSPSNLDFGGQSMATESPQMPVTFTNSGTATISVGPIGSTDPQFLQANDCMTLAAGASCTIQVSFRPAPTAGPLGGTVLVSAILNIPTGGGDPPATVALAGIAERSLVTHYYRSILRRTPDAGGKAYWDSEGARMVSLGTNVNEAWFAMAGAFFASPEYLAFGRDDSGFVTDLYRTFFSRAPDAGGLQYWVAQLQGAMPREVVLVSFMFSAEFTGVAQSIFGDTAARPEVDTVVDFYRGLLSRLSDSDGFAYWLERFRVAQCTGAGQLASEADAISSGFAEGAEYANRHRTDGQYVGDLYNAFLRRGGDAAGVQFWIQQLATGAMSRAAVRQAFLASAEFTARIGAMIARGCAGRHLLATRGLWAVFDRRGWSNGYYSGDALRWISQHDQELANVVGDANVAATVGAEIAQQLDKMKAIGVNAITFDLRTTDSYWDPGPFVPPACNVPPSIGLLYPVPTAEELAGLRDFFDLAHAKGIRVMLILNNTNMERSTDTNGGWLYPILSVVKDHPALDTVFFGGDKHVLTFSTPSCGGQAEPPLWLGPDEYAAQYLQWAFALAHGMGVPWRKLSAEAIVGNYFVDRWQHPTVATLKAVFDRLNVPPGERTYGLSMYAHRRCLNMNGIPLACSPDADPDAWAAETFQDIVNTIGAGSGARIVVPEYASLPPPSGDWGPPLAVESLTTRMAQFGVEGGAYWISTETDAGNDLAPDLAGEPMRRRGFGDVYNPVRKDLIAAYGYRLAAIPNGSFEAGGTSADSWTAAGSGTVTRFFLAGEAGQPVIAARGSYALHLATGAGATDTVHVTSAPIDAAPVARYTTTANLRFQWSGDAGTGNNPSRPHVYIAVRYFDLQDNPSTVKAQDVFRFFQEDGGASFGTFPVQYDVPVGAHRVRIEIGVMRNGLATPIGVDVDNLR